MGFSVFPTEMQQPLCPSLEDWGQQDCDRLPSPPTPTFLLSLLNPPLSGAFCWDHTDPEVSSHITVINKASCPPSCSVLPAPLPRAASFLPYSPLHNTLPFPLHTTPLTLPTTAETSLTLLPSPGALSLQSLALSPRRCPSCPFTLCRSCAHHPPTSLGYGDLALSPDTPPGPLQDSGHLHLQTGTSSKFTSPSPPTPASEGGPWPWPAAWTLPPPLTQTSSPATEPEVLPTGPCFPAGWTLCSPRQAGSQCSVPQGCCCQALG